MDIYKMKEIDSCIQGYFEDAIKGSHEGDAYCARVVRKDHYNYAMPCIIVQWWFCEEYNKIYIYYDLDEVFFEMNKDDLEKRINTRILGSISSDLGIYAEILDNIIYGNQFIEPMDSPFVAANEKITLSTLTYWKSIDGDYDFIHDSHIVLPKIFDYDMVITEEKERQVNEYISKLSIIARDYNAYDPDERNKRIPIVFKDIRNLFYEIFGYKLPDPVEYPATHPNCGPNIMYLDVYSKDDRPEYGI